MGLTLLAQCLVLVPNYLAYTMMRGEYEFVPV
jgi:hypothetical protein